MPRKRNVKYYAWSRITVKDKDGQIHLTKIGVEIKPDMFNTRDWAQLREAGSIRTVPYPTNIRSSESPRSAQLRQIREMQEQVEKGYHDLDKDDEDDEVDLEIEDDDDDEESEVKVPELFPGDPNATV